MSGTDNTLLISNAKRSTFSFITMLPAQEGPIGVSLALRECESDPWSTSCLEIATVTVVAALTVSAQSK